MRREFQAEEDRGVLTLTRWHGETDEAVIPEGIHNIGPGAFSSCRENLTTLTIPTSVTHIMFGAFSHCTQLTNLTFSEGRTGPLYIRALAFYFCQGLKKELVFPKDVTIEAGSFNSCTNLPSVRYQGSSVVHPTAFQWCKELKETAPDSEDDDDLEVITEEELRQANAASQTFLNRQRDHIIGKGKGNDQMFTKTLATPK